MTEGLTDREFILLQMDKLRLEIKGDVQEEFKAVNKKLDDFSEIQNIQGGRILILEEAKRNEKEVKSDTVEKGTYKFTAASFWLSVVGLAIAFAGALAAFLSIIPK